MTYLMYARGTDAQAILCYLFAVTIALRWTKPGKVWPLRT